MPRGSKPGERRGGRARGTPNKETVFKDAVFCAAAAQPNTSPLDFMLRLMRNPQVPIKIRIDMAAAAAPFVHARPKAPAPKRYDPMNPASSVRDLEEFTIRKMETKLSTTEFGVDDDADLTPLDFLLRVMIDPDATAGQRMRAARIAARYKHSQARLDEMPVIIEDKFGFDIDPLVARAIRDDWKRAKFLWALGAGRPQGSEKEIAECEARVRKRGETLTCPPGYTALQAKKDGRRLLEFYNSRDKLSPEEDAQEAHIAARVAAYEASPEPEARSRIAWLDWEVISKRGLSAAEQSELDELRKRYPELPDDPDDPLFSAFEAVRQAVKKSREQNSLRGRFERG